MQSLSAVNIVKEPYSVALSKHLPLVPAMMQNGMLRQLMLRCLGTGREYPFLELFRPLVWHGDRSDIITLTLFRVGTILPLTVRVNEVLLFNNRLEYWDDDPHLPRWSAFVTDGCVQLLIPSRLIELNG